MKQIKVEVDLYSVEASLKKLYVLTDVTSELVNSTLTSPP